mgnify:CR=1 FL=1
MPMIKTSLLARYYGFDYIIPYQNNLSYFFGAIHPYTGAKRTIFHIRNTVLEDKPRRSWHFNKAMNNKPLIIANSNHAKNKFQELYGNKYGIDVNAIYNGISIRKIDNSTDWKKFFKIEKTNFVATMIANFFTEKAYVTGFKAWKNFIQKTNSNSILVIAGDEGINGMMEEYRNQVKALGIANHVIFLGRTPYNIELLQVADVNILSTLNEGLPNVVIETLGTGTPFIGTEVDGVKEVVGENYPIPLFKVGDDQELISRIFGVYNGDYDLGHIRDYSANRFKLFSVKNLITNYTKIIET